MTPEPAGALVDRLATYFERGGLDPARARQAAVELFANPEALAELGRDLVELAQRTDAPYPVDVPVPRGLMTPVIDNLALYIEHEEIYRFRGEDAETHLDQAYLDLRERACADCRDQDQQEGPERWDCCVVFVGDGALHPHELGEVTE